MTSIIPRQVFVLAVGFSLCVVGLWLSAVPSVISRSTFAFLSVFVIGGAAVSLMTWRSAQPTGSVAELLHTTEMASTAASSAAPAAAVPSAWQTWDARGSNLDRIGKQRILTALLLALLLLGVFTWLA